METIHLTFRQARVLRDNLTTNLEGYDYLDLCRLDALAKRLTMFQGAYAERMAELAREEKALVRSMNRTTIATDREALTRSLAEIAYEVEDLNEQAERDEGDFEVHGGDLKLIKDKICSVAKWTGVDSLRETVIGMIQAGNAAGEDEETEETHPVLKQLKRRGK